MIECHCAMKCSFAFLFLVSFCYASKSPDEDPQSEANKELQRIWNSHCNFESPRQTTRINCAPQFRKIYLFDTTKKSFNDARNYCWQQFTAMQNAGLISIADCDEYLYIKSMLRNMSETYPTDDDKMEIWTSGMESLDIRNHQDALGDANMTKKWFNDGKDDFFDLDTHCREQAGEMQSNVTESKEGKLLTLLFDKSESDLKSSEAPVPGQDSGDRRHTLCQLKLPFAPLGPDDRPAWVEPARPVVPTTLPPDNTTEATVEPDEPLDVRNETAGTTEAEGSTEPYNPATSVTGDFPLPPIVTNAPTVPSTAETIPPEPSTESVPSTEPTLPPTPSTLPPTQATIPPTQATVPPTKATLPPTEPTVPPTPPTPEPSPAKPATDPPTEPSPPPEASTDVQTHPTFPSTFNPHPNCDPSTGVPNCPAGTVGTVTKHCRHDHSHYFEPNCRKKWFDDINEKIRKKKPVQQITETLVSNMKDENSAPSAGDVFAFIDTTDKLHELFDQQNPRPPGRPSEDIANKTYQFSSKLLQGFNSILEARHQVAWTEMPKNNRTQVASTILERVHLTAAKLGCSRSDSLLNNGNSTQVEIKDSSISVEAFVFGQNKLKSDFVFPTWGPPSRSRVTFTSDVTLSYSQTCRRYIGSGVIYKGISSHLKGTQHSDNLVVNSKLIAFSISDNHHTDLENGAKVRIVLEHNDYSKFGDEARCYFWDFDAQAWSRDGCEKVARESFRNQTTCECNHLTNFAVLMDISNREDNSNSVKQVLTIICCTLSCFALAATIILLSLVKVIQNRRSVITLNLSVCLLIVNLLVIFGMDRTENVAVCRTLSGILLYALLSAFGWMLMEGYLLYQMIILVFNSHGYITTKWLYVVAYLPPAIIIITHVSITGWNGLYDDTFGYFCWISNRVHHYYIWTFAGPALVVVFLNIFILIRSFSEALKSKQRRPGMQQPDETRKHAARLDEWRRWFKALMTLMVLVGGTWILGLAYMHEFGSWFSYVFICLNGLQGVFIFLFEIILNSNAREGLVKSLSGKIPSRYLPRISAQTSSSTLRTRSSNGNVTATTSNASGVSRRTGRSNDLPMEVRRPVPTAPEFCERL